MDSDEDDGYIVRAEREAKQNYLKEEIIENNYDGQLFMWFISNVREANIDMWEFEDLQQIVREFKMKYRRGQTLEEVNPKTDKQVEEVQDYDKLLKIQEEITSQGYDFEAFERFIEQESGYTDLRSFSDEDLEEFKLKFIESQSKVPNEVESKTEEIVNTLQEDDKFHIESQEKSSALPTEEHLESQSDRTDTVLDIENTMVVPCGILPETEITFLSDLFATCTSTSVKNPGFFSKKFIVYELVTSGLGWSVKRRYSDFLWLRNILSLTNPGSFIPPVPNKKLTGNFSENFIKKRQLLLNNFIKIILHDPILRSSPDTLIFLKEPDDKILQKYQKSRTKVQRPSNISEILTLNGDTVCDFNEHSLLFETLTDYLDVSVALESQFKLKVNNLIESTRHLSKTLNEFSEILQELQDHEEKYSESSKNLFESAKSSIVKWSTHEEIAANNLKTDLKYQFTMKISDKSVLQDLLLQRQHYFSNYKKQLKKKSELLTPSKDLFGHFNYKIKSELERTLTDQCLYDSEHLKLISKLEIDKCQSLQAFWESSSEEFKQATSFI